MRRKVRVSAVAVILAIMLTGCTGYGLSSQQKWKLDDLYMASTGIMVHVQAGEFVADVAKANGAKKAGVNLAIPYTRLAVDVWAMYEHYGDTDWTLWEIKPDKYFFNGKLDAALAQLKGYVDNMQKAGYGVVQTGSGVYFPAPGTPVPDEYTPQAYARCLQVVVVSRPELGSNIIGYFYRWHPQKRVNGKKCKEQDDDVRNQNLAGFASDAAEFVKQKFEHVSPAQMALAITAKKNDLATIRQQLVDVLTYDDDPDDGWIDPGTTKVSTHSFLMDYDIPVIFRTTPEPNIPFPGIQEDQGDSWTCDRVAC